VLELVNGKRILSYSSRLEEGQETEASLEWYSNFDYIEVIETTGKAYRKSLDRKVKDKFKSIKQNI
jgi:hypothetical protein